MFILANKFQYQFCRRYANQKSKMYFFKMLKLFMLVQNVFKCLKTKRSKFKDQLCIYSYMASLFGKFSFCFICYHGWFNWIIRLIFIYYKIFKVFWGNLYLNVTHSHCLLGEKKKENLIFNDKSHTVSKHNTVACNLKFSLAYQTRSPFSISQPGACTGSKLRKF